LSVCRIWTSEPQGNEGCAHQVVQSEHIFSSVGQINVADSNFPAIVVSLRHYTKRTGNDLVPETDADNSDAGRRMEDSACKAN